MILIIMSIATVILSFIMDKKKTLKGLKIALQRFLGISLSLLTMIITLSIILYLFPQNIVSKYFNDKNIYISSLIAALIGSISLMPGYIAFPLGGILRGNGVSYMVISAFTTTLMMVGVLTFPLEKAYLGFKAALIRNILSFLIALIVAVFIGIFFGEVFL